MSSSDIPLVSGTALQADQIRPPFDGAPERSTISAMSPRPLLFYVVVAFLGLMLAACGDDKTDGPQRSPTSAGPPRSFAMGLSSLPAELTEEGYSRAFELAASAGGGIMIQRTPP